MFDKRHFYYRFSFTASNDNHSQTYSFEGSSDDDNFGLVKKMFFRDFNEYPTRITRDSADRIDISKH